MNTNTNKLIGGKQKNSQEQMRNELWKLFSYKFKYNSKELINTINSLDWSNPLFIDFELILSIMENDNKNQHLISNSMRTVSISVPIEDGKKILTTNCLKAAACFPYELDPVNDDSWFDLSEQHYILTQLAQSSFYGSPIAANLLRRIATQYTNLPPYHEFWKNKYSKAKKFVTYLFPVPIQNIQPPPKNNVLNFFEMNDENFTTIINVYKSIESEGLPVSQSEENILMAHKRDDNRGDEPSDTDPLQKRVKINKEKDIEEETTPISLSLKKTQEVQIYMIKKDLKINDNKLWKQMEKNFGIEVKKETYTGERTIVYEIGKDSTEKKTFKLELFLVSDYKNLGGPDKIEKKRGVVFFDQLVPSISEEVARELELKGYEAFLFYSTEEPIPCYAKSTNWYLDEKEETSFTQIFDKFILDLKIDNKKKDTK